MTRAGVLGLQGDFIEHLRTLREMGVEAIDVRRPEQLDEVDALIVPGGESTTIGKLAAQYGIIPKLRERVAAGMPVWGTCAGAIFLAKEVPAHPHPLAGLMDITVERNAFGRQIDSFGASVRMPKLSTKSIPVIFIRAPIFESPGKDIEVLARLPDKRIIAAREKNMLMTSFHPELVGTTDLHRYFLTF